MKRTIYLEDIPLDEAQAALANALHEAGLWQPMPAEWVPLTQAVGRVTAVAVWAKISSPHYHASAMDGYAVRAQDTAGATETNPIQFALVDEWENGGSRPAKAVNTGHALPGWANAVIMIEQTQQVTLANGTAGIEDSRRRAALASRTADGRRHGRDGAGAARQPQAAPG